MAKTYRVAVDGPLSDAEAGLLRRGIDLDDGLTQPAAVSVLETGSVSTAEITIREGRKRQIRRMCELVGLRVLALRRVRIGSVVLGRLPPGQWRLLRDDERF